MRGIANRQKKNVVPGREYLRAKTVLQSRERLPQRERILASKLSAARPNRTEGQMQRLRIDPEHPKMRHIQRAVEVLRSGGVIIYPTDTIYGLGCDIFNRDAVKRVYHIKGKNYKSPLSFICPDLKEISRYAYVSNMAYRIMRKALPGPYTFVLPATNLVPKLLLSNRKTVGIRVPDHPICLELLKQFGGPIVSTSVVGENGELLNDPDEIERQYKHRVDLMLDAGILGLTPSTVVDLTSEKPVILREGKGDPTLIY